LSTRALQATHEVIERTCNWIQDGLLGVELNVGTEKDAAASGSFVAGPASPALMGTKFGLLIQAALKKKREAVSLVEREIHCRS
jgi:hypothetical protein